MRLLGKANTTFARTIRLLAFLAGVLLILVMFGINAEIVMRYFFNRPIFWMEEVAGYSLLYITFLGAVWLLRDNGHVRMDLVLGRLSKRRQAKVNTGTSILGAIICLVVTWYGVLITWEYFQLGITVPSLLKPPQSPIMVVIPIGSFLLFIQFLKMAYRNWRNQGTT